jgi:two-component sensor histidine kinase
MDVVGQFTAKGRALYLDQAVSTRRKVLARSSASNLIPTSDEGYPVVIGGKVVAVIQRTSALSARQIGELETAYLATFDALIDMTIVGDFPPGAGAAHSDSPPRVSDGLIQLDAAGIVKFASPNAVSAFHRMGLAFGIQGQHLANTLMRLLRTPGPANETLMLLAGGRAAGQTEVENANAILTLRAIPLTQNNQRLGALILTRDVSELRRKEKSLLTKDASIREIHHRVKNNLQTVAALLRLQSRRSDSEEVRTALEEAQRRVAAIATVHEILAYEPGTTVDFDEIVDRLILMVRDMTRGMRQGTIEKSGSFGQLRSEQATALAMALSELIGNAVEHGIGLRAETGLVQVRVERTVSDLTVWVLDDGPGLPADGVVEGLGLSIVRTIVTQDLKGEFEIAGRDPEGTSVKVKVPLG